MASDKRHIRSTFRQIGALSTLIITGVWAVTVIGLHFTSPLTADTVEITLLTALAIMFLVHTPLYWQRVPWSYLSDLLLYLIMFAGAVKEAASQGLFFSVSAYNVATVYAQRGGR